MMPRILHRGLAAVFALWFTVFTVEPARMHSCPMHDGSGGEVSRVGAHAAHAAHAGHMGMATHEGASHLSQPSAPEPHQAHHCTCPDRCCCSAVPAMPAAAGRVAATGGGRDAVVASGYVAVVRRAEYVLPFANAPPGTV
jgi:hypothetical protein